MRNPGETCYGCGETRRNALELLKPLRNDIKQHYKQLHGEDYGITVGLRSRHGYIEWFDIVVLTENIGMGLS